MAVTPMDQANSPDAAAFGPAEGIVEPVGPTPESDAPTEAAPATAVLSDASPAAGAAASSPPPVAVPREPATPNVQAAIADEMLASEAQAAIKRRQMEARATHATSNDGFSLRTRPPRVIMPPPKVPFWRIDKSGVLVARITIAACLGLAGGSLGVAGVTYLVAQRDAQSGGPAGEEIRNLRETVAQMRASMKTMTDQIAALRSNADSASKTNGEQVAQLNENLDRLGRAQAASAARLARTLDAVDGPEPEATGSLASAPAAKSVIPGWSVRRAYEDTAILEGRMGVVQVNIGQDVPGIGRIQEIRRQQSGRWLIVTDKGVIVSTR